MNTLLKSARCHPIVTAARVAVCAAATALLLGCGGGGGDSADTSSATAGNAAPAAAQRTATEPGCTNALIQMKIDSLNPGVPGDVRSTGEADALFSFKVPPTGQPVVHACALVPLDTAYTPPPVELTAVLAGNRVLVNLRMAGDIDAFQDKKLALKASRNLLFLSEAELATYHVVAYTQDAAGAWKRESLPSTLLPPRSLEALVTAEGYYTIEKN
jgi:hypothetical protein